MTFRPHARPRTAVLAPVVVAAAIAVPGLLFAPGANASEAHGHGQRQHSTTGHDADNGHEKGTYKGHDDKSEKNEKHRKPECPTPTPTPTPSETPTETPTPVETPTPSETPTPPETTPPAETPAPPPSAPAPTPVVAQPTPKAVPVHHTSRPVVHRHSETVVLATTISAAPAPSTRAVSPAKPVAAELPHTGGNGTAVYALLGGILILAGGAATVAGRRRS